MLSATSPNSAEGEQRKGDGRHAQRAEQRRPPDGESASRRASLTTAPRWRACRRMLRVLQRIEDDPAVVELDGAVVRAPDELEIVGRHQHGGAGGVDVAEQLEHAARGAFVEVAGRFVGDEHERIVHERARDGDALLLAA